jgi:competence protein ComEC
MPALQHINWKKTPFIRLILPLIAGILIAIYQELSSFLWVIPLVSMGIITFALFIQKKWIQRFSTNFWYGISVYFTLFLFGLNLVILQTQRHYTHHYSHHITENQPTQLYIEIEEIPKQKAKSIYTIAQVKAVQIEGALVPVMGHIILYLAKDDLSKQIIQGDQLMVSVNLQGIQSPRNPDEFNYQQYLRFHQIYHQAYAPADQWKLLEKGTDNLTKFAGSTRDFLLSLLKENGLNDEELSVASALILGYKDDLSTDLKHAYSSAGAMHVLAVSGLHVGILFMVLNNLLIFMDRSRKLVLIKVSILLLFLWFYALITGLSPSVIRAATMFSFVVIGGAFNRSGSIYNTLAVSAFVLLCINPYLVMEVGFQLSYLAVLGIVYFQPKIYNLLYFKNTLVDKIWVITSVSIAAQIATFPLGLLYFHQFPTYFLFSNLFVIPGAMIIIALGILVFITSPIKAVAFGFAWLLNQIINWMNYLIIQIDQLPFSLIEGISISIFGCWLIYAIIMSGVISLEFRRLKYVNWGIGCLLLFLVLDIVEDVKLRKENEVVIYAVKNENAINFISATDNLIFCSETLWNNESQLLFHIKHHWFERDHTMAKRIDFVAFVNTSTVYKLGPVYQFEEHRVVYFDTIPTSLQEEIQCDIWLIDNPTAKHFSELSPYIRAHTIVLQSDVRRYLTQEIKEGLVDENIVLHDMSNQGAFVGKWQKKAPSK